MFYSKDVFFMKRAISLAKKGEGHTKSNPMVGCVIVKNGKIIGEGYHKFYGGNHAEIEALHSCKSSPFNSTMYVTLEPCAHSGKMGPCVDEIINNHIQRVVIAIEDPNPKVSGKSIKMLKEHGIEVEVGLLEDEVRQLNETFLHYINEKKPFVCMKIDTTLDGKIATISGESKWISCEKSRKHTRRLRKNYQATMVGINTVLKDDPHLKANMINADDPIRVIIDSKLKINLDANVLKAKNTQTLIYTSKDYNKEKMVELNALKNVQVIVTDSRYKVNLNMVMRDLAKRSISSVLLEGGGTLNYSMLKENLVNKIIAVISPQIVGGKKAPLMVSGEGVEFLKDSIHLEKTSVKMIDEDVVITSYVKKEA